MGGLRGGGWAGREGQAKGGVGGWAGNLYRP